MRKEGISLEEAVERVYAEAAKQTVRALQAGEVGEPYRWVADLRAPDCLPGPNHRC